MAIEVKMPQMGESIAEGTLVRWLKGVGDLVERDEPLFEISTDKVDTEIPSPAAGVLQEIRVTEGETVPVQTIVAVLASEQGAAAPAAPAPEPPARATPAPSAAPKAPPPTPRPPAPAAVATPARAAAPSPPSRESRAARVARRSSPLVRRIAREHGVDVAEIEGTGSNGRVTKSDILAYIEDRGVDAPVAAPAPRAATAAAVPLPAFEAGDVEVQPMSTMRRKIAEHMVMSKQTSPHVTTVFEVDMTRVAALIEKNKERFLKTNGVKLTYMPFIMKATVSALREYPIVNAAVSGNDVHYFKRVNIGIAVALDEGLLVPVVKDAEDKSLLGLSRAVKDLATRARAKKLQPDDVQGGTFTITNHGVFGSLFATPVINQPQVAILGVGTVTKRPVVLPDSDAIAVRSMMYLALSFDHRLIDGATADKFVGHIKSLLEVCDYSLES